MNYSKEVMDALADAYSSALSTLMRDAIEDGFWFGRGHITHRQDRDTSMDLNWGDVANREYGGGYRTLFDAED